MSIKQLKVEREALKSQLQRFSEFVVAYSDNQSAQLKARYEKIEHTLDEFNSVQLDIEKLEPKEGEANESERVNFECSYFEVIAAARQHLHVTESPSLSTHESNHSAIEATIKLPQLALPTFSGNYTEWNSFRDSFTAIVHDNRSLPDIQKFQYLKGQLSGIAARAIQSLPLTSQNYKIAFDTLRERFENTRLAVDNHIRAIMAVKNISKENYSELRSLLDTLVINLRSLTALNIPVNTWDAIIIYILCEKLDAVTAREWRSCKIKNDLPTMQEFITFLEERCSIMESLLTRRATSEIPAIKAHAPRKTHTFAATVSICQFCNHQHPIYRCKRFFNQPVPARISAIKALKICGNCLHSDHTADDCKAGHCRKCNRYHHTLLHVAQSPSREEAAAVGPRQQVVATDPSEDIAVVLSSQSAPSSAGPQVLLSTAYVNASNDQGRTQQIRALLDAASQSNFITERACKRLNLQRVNKKSFVSGIGNGSTNIQQVASVKISSNCTAFSRSITCLVLPQITGNLPVVSFNADDLILPPNLRLADASFNESGPIEMLLGAELFWDLLLQQQLATCKNGPILQNTELGWIVAGLMHLPQRQSNITFTHCALTDALAKFWEIEEPTEPTLPPDHQVCEEIFEKTTKRTADGRFSVQLPLRECVANLGDSRTAALKRFHSLEFKLQRSPELRTAYSSFMEQYESLGHMTVIDENLQQPSLTYYLPHHGITKESSMTTKHRTVFDGSAKTTTGISLNDSLYVGPTVQPDIFSILVRFRSYRYAMTADIEMMYRQVLVDEEQRNLQRIFWRDRPDKVLACYQLNTITYGLASAPYLATRCLKQLALDHSKSDPTASATILKNIYVDDLLAGADDLELAIKLRNDVDRILRSAQFNLRKWIANETLLIPHDGSDTNLKAIPLGETDVNKTLGVYWNPTSDRFQYMAEVTDTRPILTKRILLSTISKIYDPLGLIAPVITIAKLIIQSLWLARQSWDEPVDYALSQRWIVLHNELQYIQHFRIPRRIICNDPVRIELHSFCDASERAYGASIYLRSISHTGETRVNLICSKSRVAPVRKVALPRLELLGALLVARLANRVTKVLDINIDSHHFWCDSTIALCWIKADSTRWKTFVANRVAEIQSLTDSRSWYHVPTDANAADVVSRGCSPRELEHHSMWWHGPSFLHANNNLWPSQNNIPMRDDDLPELRPISIALAATDVESAIWNRYSSLQTLLHVTAYCSRFCNNSRGKAKLTGPLSVQEVQQALIRLVKAAQEQSLSEDIHDLARKGSIKRRHKIKSLCPFIDEDGILRVGGRLTHANLSYDAKHPVILPTSHKLTTLIARKIHRENLHCGPGALLAHMRQQYWPIGGRNLTRKIVNECVVCFRAKPRPSSYKMGNLPRERLLPSPPFFNCGIDYAGPFLIKDKRTRGCKTIKAYASIFICLSTKAVHLELVSSLSSDAFIATLRRFIARRGAPSAIYSDNATNFLGARNQLKELHNLISDADTQSKLRNLLLEKQISWHFIPPRAPNFGGLWEAAVKSLKIHLVRVASNASLVYEDFVTLLNQIEAILNSRPLSPLSSNPEDLQPLTPGHFLIGRPITALIDDSLVDSDIKGLSQYQRIQQILNDFWKRWTREYLSELQHRRKWDKDNASPPTVGSLVILKEDNTPPCRWHLGRIASLHPGPDGTVRTATIRTINGEVKRAMTKVCVLPLSEQGQ